MTPLDEARARWLKERDQYDAFGRIISKKIRGGVRSLGLWCETSYRTKEAHSLIKKLLRKPAHTYDSLPDKVGARCIIRYRDDLSRVVEVAQALFECGPVDSKADSLGADQIGYLSVHIDVSFREEDPLRKEFLGLRGELQIRTLAQHLWSEMAHDSVYKNDEVFSQLPSTLRRRVNLLAGMIEVADMEFNRLTGELKQRPEVEIYKNLEPHFYRLTARSPDPALSLDVISILLPLYEDAPVPLIASRVDTYVHEHQRDLQSIYTLQEEHPTTDLIFQPEALLIAELLNAVEPTSLRTVWSSKFPERELERLAIALGHSFD